MTKKLNVLEDENLKVRNCTKGNKVFAGGIDQ